MEISNIKKNHMQAGQVDLEHLPRHIAVIMDGNGRWAKKRNLPRTAGHKVGAETFRTIAKYCKEIGVEYLTVYAFSTENWKRPKEEVDVIMGLLKKYLYEVIDTVEKENIRFKVLGDTTPLDEELKSLIHTAEEKSRLLDGFQANICLNYGGRDEILHAARKCLEDHVPLTEENFSQRLYTAEIPDPELIIRPSGEIRLSNFLLWQCAYSEFYFCDTLWPDFTKDTLNDAIISFQKRNRRFGNIQ